MLNLMISSPMELQMKTLPKILPFVHGLTWFYLDIQLEGPLSFRLLNDIVEYSQLEYLCLVLEAQDTINLDYFFNKLATGCPKLRKITLGMYSEFIHNHIIEIFQTIDCCFSTIFQMSVNKM